MKKVLVKGPALSLSGYGEQARFAIRSLRDRKDIDLYFVNIPWGKTGQFSSDEKEKEFLLGLIDKTKKLHQQTNGKMDFDVSVQVTIPNEFEKIAKVNIGYTAGIETTKVSPEWIEKSNTMDKIIVPSNHSKRVFEETVYIATNEQTGEQTEFKLATPVEVCSFPALKTEPNVPDLNLSTDWNFISVAQWGPRKNVEATVIGFLKEFKDDNAGLILKLNMAKNSTMDKCATQKRLQSLVERFKKENGDVKCKVYLLHGNLTDEEMRGLYHHPKVKAFVTTTHGEGFGLPMFDAAIAELPIVAPAWSSYVDFLYAPKKIKGNKEKNKPHFTKIDFELQKVQKEAVWEGVIRADSQWCFVKDHSVRSAMREVFKNYGPKLSDAKKLSKFILENISEEKQNNMMSTLIAGEPERQVLLDEIPKITLITSVFDAEEHIEQLMEDVTRQTIFEEKCEWIIINANPDDRNFEEDVIMKYAEKFSENIKYRRLEQDPGIYAVWNMAIKQATGEFITNINCDDRRSPDALEKQAKMLVISPDASLVYNDSYVTEEPNINWEKISNKVKRYNFEHFSKQAMMRANLPHNNPMWRKKLHDKHGFFEEKYRSASDWEFWLRCTFGGEVFVKHPEVLGIYYFNPKGMSTNHENFSWKQEEEKEIFKKYQDIFESNK